MKNKLLIVAGIIVATFLATIGLASAAITRIDVNPPLTYVATSSVAYLVNAGATATTTAQSVQDIDESALYVQYAASTTGSTLGIKYQFSNDKIDWYDYGVVLTPSSATLTQVLATTTNFTYTPATTATSSIVMKVPSVPSLYVRAILQTTVANGAVYYQFDHSRKGYNSVNGR